ncbi:MAG: nitroreductase family protein [Planctomycetota bacterium]
MKLIEAIHARRSVRAFVPKPVDEAKVKRILDAANDAPSAGNLQAYEIVVVRDPARKRKLADAAHGQMFVAMSPLVLVFVANPTRNRRYRQRGEELYAVQDATIACVHAMLAATTGGLASCWVGAFDEKAVAEVVGVPVGMRPVAILPIGHAAEKPKNPGRRDLDDIVHDEEIGVK